MSRAAQVPPEPSPRSAVRGGATRLYINDVQTGRGRPRGLPRNAAGFTLAELLIGMGLGMIVMFAVLSSYVFLVRNFTRLANQQTVEAQSRRTLSTFEQDVRVASAVTSATSSAVTLTIPAAASAATTDVSYTYYSSATTVGGVSIPAESLVRRSPASSGTPRVLLQNLVSLSFGTSPYTYGFKFYDAGGTEIPAQLTAADLRSVKHVSLSFILATGSASNGTKTATLYGNSPRLALRNKPLLQ